MENQNSTQAERLCRLASNLEISLRLQTAQRIITVASVTAAAITGVMQLSPEYRDFVPVAAFHLSLGIASVALIFGKFTAEIVESTTNYARDCLKEAEKDLGISIRESVMENFPAAKIAIENHEIVQEEFLRATRGFDE